MNSRIFEKIYKLAEMARPSANNLKDYINEHPEVYDLYKKGNKRTPEEKKQYKGYMDDYYSLYPDDERKNPKKSRSRGFADSIFPIAKQMANSKSKFYRPDIVNASVSSTKFDNSDYFEQFEPINKVYLPPHGDGTNMATQAVTAICKLVYKWYNDGDVYDNTYELEGWANDISGSANWLYTYIPETRSILRRIEDIRNSSDEYEKILMDVADVVYKDDLLKSLEKREKIGNAYKEDGPFKFVEIPDDEDEWDDEEDYASYDDDEDDEDYN